MQRAGAVVTNYLLEQRVVLLELADDVRDDGPDAIHRSRVAARRARSALRGFGPVFRRKPARALREDLRAYGRLLGPTRDAEVLRERIADSSAQIGLANRFTARLLSELDQEQARAHADLVRSLGSRQHLEVIDRLARFVADPPLRAPGRRPAEATLPGVWATSISRVERRLAHADADLDDLERWHEVRKAAKVARYCAEVMVPLGIGADEHADAWKAVTSALGDLQDTVVSVEALDRHTSARKPQSYHALRALERQRRRDAVTAGRRALADALALPPITAG